MVQINETKIEICINSYLRNHTFISTVFYLETKGLLFIMISVKIKYLINRMHIVTRICLIFKNLHAYNVNIYKYQYKCFHVINLLEIFFR
jgi:uncharacterized Fe-S cluster-containing radical SAM superfamily protein